MQVNNRTAFSLIELLVVIAIVSTLAVSGYLAYSAYIVRAQISEAFRVLDEYKVIAASLLVRTGTITPYNVLFTDTDLSGFISGTPNGTSAVKQVSLKYINTIEAYSGVDGNGNTYILLGVGLNNSVSVEPGADHVYVAGIQDSTGLFTWQCGSSVSQANTVSNIYLPENCQTSLP